MPSVQSNTYNYNYADYKKKDASAKESDYGRANVGLLKAGTKGSVLENINVETQIENTLEISRIPIKSLENKITQNQSKIDEYQKLKDLLVLLNDKAAALKRPSNIALGISSVFDQKVASINTNTAVLADTYIKVAVDNYSQANQYTFSNLVLGTAKKQVASGFANGAVVSATGAPFMPGTFEINGQSITLNEGDSLQDVANNINFYSNLTGVTASLRDNQATLILRSTQAGADNAYTITDANNIFNDPSVRIPTIVWNQTNATNASVSIKIGDDDAETITSSTSTNKYNGISYTLRQNTPPDTTINLTVASDSDKIAEVIGDFMLAYNEVKTFLNQAQQIDLKNAKLIDSQVLMRIQNILSSDMSNSIAHLQNSKYKNIIDIGLSLTNVDKNYNPLSVGILRLDEAKFKNALQTNLDSVRSLFELRYTSTNNKFTPPREIDNKDFPIFTLSIDANNVSDIARISYVDSNGITNNIAANYTKIDNSDFADITGVKGTIFEGLVIRYKGDGFDRTTISLSKGIAHKIANDVNSIAFDQYGLIASKMSEIQNDTTSKEEKVSKLEDQAEKKKKQIIDTYTRTTELIETLTGQQEYLSSQIEERYYGKSKK
jgi:flagellar capping protein FliD